MCIRDRSRPATAPVSAAEPTPSAGSPAESSSAASCVPPPAPVQTPALPRARSCLLPEQLAEPAHKAPLSTSLRCFTNSALNSSTQSFAKPKSGGLVLPRRITPLSRRDAVYVRSGVYTGRVVILLHHC